MTIHVSLKRANLNSFNVSAPDFHVWQHFGSNWSTAQIQKLANVSKKQVTQLYSHLIGHSKTIQPFGMNRSSEEEGSSLIGKFLSHTGTYLGFPGMTYIASMGIYCSKKFLGRPVSPMCWPYTQASSGQAIVDDDLEGASLYKSGGKVEHPVRPCENHDLHM